MISWQGRATRFLGAAALGLALVLGTGSTALAQHRGGHGGHHHGSHYRAGYHGYHGHRGGGDYRGYRGFYGPRSYGGWYGYRAYRPRVYAPRYWSGRSYYPPVFGSPYPYLYQPWYGGGYYR